MQPVIVSQPREELDAGRAVLRRDQRLDHAHQGITAVEDRKAPALGDPGLFAEQFHGQLALGAEGLSAPGFPWPQGNCDLRKWSRPETGRNQAGFHGTWSKTPRTTQLCARSVVARLGQQGVYSWNVQVSQT